MAVALCGADAGIHSVQVPGNTWTQDDLGAFVGRALYRVFRDA